MKKTIKMVTVGFLTMSMLSGCGGLNNEGNNNEVPNQEESPNTVQNLNVKQQFNQEEKLALTFVDKFYNGTKASERDHFIDSHVDKELAEVLKMGDISDTNNVSNLRLIDSADHETKEGLNRGTIVKLQGENVSGDTIQIYVHTLGNQILKISRSDADREKGDFENVFNK